MSALDNLHRETVKFNLNGYNYVLVIRSPRVDDDLRILDLAVIGGMRIHPVTKKISIVDDMDYLDARKVYPELDPVYTFWNREVEIQPFSEHVDTYRLFTDYIPF